MKKQILFWMFLSALLLAAPAGAAPSEALPPIVSVDWLEANLKNPKLIILDVRKVEDYREGHIPNAINTFHGAWAYKRGKLFTEVPDPDDLEDTIGSAGIGWDSWVVVVGNARTLREIYQVARVACTLRYAGLDDVAILDGGMDKWIRDKKILSTKVVSAKEKLFRGKFRKDHFADKEYVQSRMGKIVLLDVREADIFTGKRKLDCITKLGHIPGAVNLPTSCAFNSDGTIKSKEALTALAEAAVGKDRSTEIVTYCDVGQCCPVWKYLMKRLLGYKNVRIYDGAMQEWTSDPDAPVTK
ncbi:MAG: putative thiosulfate sulfurtransferase [Syntrophaceae bacterium PtaB.Bin095]|jgi:thiosulfate/3-mercaptopyruvate sulfurtransferase|nr:MAG: putative thiosulfate sulfurtransferase [Syntrophaceae bacterium PtaB.Bin095]